MFRAIDIILSHYNTFYNYRTEGKSYPFVFWFFVLIASALFSYFSNAVSSNLISVSATFSAVVAGFSYSVLFFLASQDSSDLEFKSDSIERNIVGEKIKIVKVELEANVSYVIFLSIFIICLCFVKYASEMIQIPRNFYPKYINLIFYINTKFFIFLFALCHFELIFNFLRNVVRMNFYISKK